jgi:hypothetical protein
MSDLVGRLKAAGRSRASAGLGFAVAAFLGVAVWSAPARASGCANTFTNTAGGSWFTAANWSKGSVPTAGEEVCITEAGTYTVEMVQTSTAPVYKSLTVGASSGAQTLLVASTASANALLSTSEGTGVGAHGAITMTNSPFDTDANGVALGGPVVNAGTVAVEAGRGGSRHIEGAFTNTGTLTIGANTEFDVSKTLTNEGALDVAEGKQLTVSGKGAVVNGSGGSIAAGATGGVLAGSGSSFTQGAGTTSTTAGSEPVVVDDGSLTYSGSGASLIRARGTTTLAGNIAAGQTLVLESTSSENLEAKASASFENAGAIVETNSPFDSDANNVRLLLIGGTLANSGSFTTEAGRGGSRKLAGNLTNTGTLAIGANTEYAEVGTLANEGTLDLAEGRTLTVTQKASVVNGSGGSIAASGGELLMSSGTSFTQGAGTTSTTAGSEPVVVDDGSLTYSGSGASLIRARGSSSTLAGNLAAGQTLVLESTSSENVEERASASFTNAGSIVETNSPFDSDANNVRLTLPVGATLANSGSLATEAGRGGSRQIAGSLTNTGMLTVGANTEYDGELKTLTNEGALDVAEGKALAVSNKGIVVNGAGSSISGGATGGVSMGSGTSFTQGAGTTSGSEPVVLDDAALAYSGSGASLIRVRGSSSTLAGNLAAGQTLVLESTSSENATVTAPGALVDAGTIAMVNSPFDSDGNNVTLRLASGTLEDKGKLLVEENRGGARTIEAPVKSEKTLFLGAGAALRIDGSYTQTKKGTLEVAVNSASSFGASTITGEAALEGTLKLKQAKGFTPAEGAKFPILTTSARTGVFAKVKKNKIKKTSLLYEPTYSATGVTLLVEP